MGPVVLGLRFLKTIIIGDTIVAKRTSPKKKRRWRDAFHPDERVQRWRPEYSDAYLGNPHKGTATFQRFEGDPLYPDIGWDDREGPIWFRPPRKNLKNTRYPPTRISYCRWLWNVLEPKKGKFRWDILDGALKAAAERNQTLQIRTQPFIGDSTPKWYWETGAGQFVTNKGRIEPDHNDPLYLKHWGNHIRAIGKRYDGHPALESFDVAYGGACGECGGNTNKATAAKLVEVYMRAFRKTQLVGMLGTDGNAHMASVKPGKFGWRADCYGDCRTKGNGQVPDGLIWNHMLEAYPKEVAEDGVRDAWKTAPVTFETCWTVAYWERQGWDIDWIIDQGYKYHISVFMPKSVYIPDEWMEKMMAFTKRIGYRFFVHNMILPLEAKPGERILFETTIDNRGIAPIYRDYTFALRFTQGRKHYIVPFKQDIRSWLPDFNYFKERVTFPRQLKRGEVKLSCAIVDKKNVPVVKLAHKKIDRDGWHPMTSMDVRL